MKWFTRIFQVFILIFLVLGLGVIALVTLVDPNQYKVALQDEIRHRTQRELVLEGPLRWRLLPFLSIESDGFTLSDNPRAENQKVENQTATGSQTIFLKVQKARVTAHLWSLISGILLFDLELQGADVQLQRFSATQNNWQDLIYYIKQGKVGSKRLMLNAVHVKNATVDWQDNVQERHYLFKNLEFASGELLAALRGRPSHAMVSGIFVAEGQEKNIDIMLKTDWKLADGFETLEFKDIHFKSDLNGTAPLLLSGDAKVMHLKSTPLLQGYMAVQPFALAPWADYFNMKIPFPLPETLALNANYTFDGTWLHFVSFEATLPGTGVYAGQLKILPKGDLKTIMLQGDLQGKPLNFSAALIPSLKTSFIMQKGILNLSPLELQWDKITHTASMEIDFNHEVPKIKMTQEGSNAEVQSLLDALDSNKSIGPQLKSQADQVLKNSKESVIKYFEKKLNKVYEKPSATYE